MRNSLSKFFYAIILLILLITGTGPQPAYATGICYVNDDAAGAIDGTSWTDAYTSLQSAIADTCTEIWVAAGIYKPHTLNRAVSFALENGTSIYGGFAGTETLRSQRDLAANVTILSGDINGDDSQSPIITNINTVSGNTNNSYHVVTGSGTNSSAILDGFIITAGQANGASDPNDRGGGLFNNGGSPAINNVSFSGNSASFIGGGMYNFNISNPTVSNSTFSSNSANEGGGMANLDNSSPIVNSSTFSGNSAFNNGGGMYNYTGSPTVSNSTFSGNSAANGGGISNVISTPVINNTIIANSTGGDCTLGGGSITASYNLIKSTGSSACGLTNNSNGNIIGSDPNLGLLTGSPAYFPLNTGSPAINAGTNTGCPDVDQRGVIRPQNGTCDIGSFEYDNTAPTISSIIRASANPTSASSVDFTVTFSEPVQNVDANDFSLTVFNITGASVSNVSGSDTIYVVTVNTGSRPGTLRLDVNIGVNITDTAGNALSNLPFTSGETYTIDKIGAPTDISLSASSLDENLPSGSTIGTLSSTDFNAGDTFTYSFCGGSDDASFTITGDILSSAVVFDHETKSSYSICIRSTDQTSMSTTKDFTILINDLVDTQIFNDVPPSYWAYSFIERLYNSGITGGCSTNPLSYCPIDPVTRAQMAVFLLKGIHGPGFAPPAVGDNTGFTDVDITHWAAAWIKQLATEAITSGCGSGIYCPENTVTRAQMAVFLLKAKHGASYTPPNVSATFGDTSGHWAEDWIEQLAKEGITSGCGNGNYCPENPVTRDQMAVFLVKSFNLP